MMLCMQELVLHSGAVQKVLLRKVNTAGAGHNIGQQQCWHQQWTVLP